MSLKSDKEFAIDDSITLIKVIDFMLRAGA